MDFGAFFDIKNKQDFKLQIILYQRSIRMEVLAEVIEALASVVQHLKQHGACVTVSWTYRGRWEKYNRPPPRRDEHEKEENERTDDDSTEDDDH
ncbi:unnamed protein product [Alternaria alternata]